MQKAVAVVWGTMDIYMYMSKKGRSSGSPVEVSWASMMLLPEVSRDADPWHWWTLPWLDVGERMRVKTGSLANNHSVRRTTFTGGRLVQLFSDEGDTNMTRENLGCGSGVG